jgi:hypothetical protein
MAKTENAPNVHMRLLNLRADDEIRKMSKVGNADMGKYQFDFYTEEQTTDLSCRMGAKYGLLIIPTERHVEYGPPGGIVRATVTMAAINVDEPDDQLTIEGYGAFDGAMADAKALTYAMRRASCILLGLGSSEAEPERKQTASEIRRDIAAKLPREATVTAPTPKTPTTPKTDRFFGTPAPAPKAPATPTTPAKPAVPVPTADEWRAEMRTAAVTLFADGRISEAQATECDKLLKDPTCTRATVAEFLTASDIDHEAI